MKRAVTIGQAFADKINEFIIFPGYKTLAFCLIKKETSIGFSH